MPAIEFLTEHTTIEFDHTPAVRYFRAFQDFGHFHASQPHYLLSVTKSIITRWACIMLSLFFELAQGHCLDRPRSVSGLRASAVSSNGIDLSYRRARGNIGYGARHISRHGASCGRSSRNTASFQTSRAAGAIEVILRPAETQSFRSLPVPGRRSTRM